MYFELALWHTVITDVFVLLCPELEQELYYGDDLATAL